MKTSGVDIFVQLNLLVDFIPGDNREELLTQMRFMWNHMPGKTYSFYLISKSTIVSFRSCGLGNLRPQKVNVNCSFKSM